MANTRVIKTKFWKDSYIVGLNLHERHLFLYLLTNPSTNISGIYEINVREIHFDTGITKNKIIQILDKFEKDRKIKYVDGWIAIKNWTKHQLENPSVGKGIERCFQEAPKVLVQWVNGQTDPSLETDCPQSALLNLTKPNLTYTEKKMKVSFNYETGEFEGITDEYINQLDDKYPGVDVEGEIAKMGDWLIDNPGKKRQGKRSFINRWLTKATPKVESNKIQSMPWFPGEEEKKRP